MTETDLIAALSPPQVVALTLYGEARGATRDDDHDGVPDLLEAIASVILNRVKAQDRRWGLTAQEVCLKPWQFSCWKPEGGKANHETVLLIAAHLLKEAPLGPIMRTCLALGAEVCTGTLKDTVRGATHYYSTAAMTPPGSVPKWAVGLDPVAYIGGTRFFSNVWFHV